jgi:HD-GYP domain-containing protein (c-di-GMP phosphodiesterase class II)
MARPESRPRLQTARLPLWRRLGWRLAASVLLLTALGILVSGFLQYRAQERWLRASLGELLLNIARTGALVVDGDVHEAVVRSGRKDTLEYETLRARLRQIQDANSLPDAVYTLSDVDGAMARFAVVSNGLAPVGLPYRLAPEIQPLLRRVLSEGTPAYSGIYVSSSGTWITAFAPVLNSAGRPVAALDVDFRADVYVSQLAAVRRRLYLHSLAAGVVALAAGIVLARRITRPVGELAAAARRVVEGDFSAAVRLRTNDEIGLLGNVFHLMVDRVRVSHRSMVDVVVRALEAREGAPGALRRVARAALAVGERLPLTRTQRESLELGALLHDIGEIRTPEALLQKPGQLTAEERLVVAAHPQAGIEMLETVPLLTPALDVVGAHHERWDGGGYPQGLKGEDIPFVARVFAVVDALDAMTHARPYRGARSIEAALDELGREAGHQFDPQIVEAALAIPVERWVAVLDLERPETELTHA